MSDDQPRVEDELAELLESAALTRRQAGAVAARLGFDGAGAGTLQDAARDWGYSRERVRQLEARLRDRSAEDRPLLPAVRAALELIEATAPDERSWVAGRIADAGLARRPFDPAGVLAAAELIGAEPTARVSGRFVTPVHLPDPIVPLLRTAEAIAAEYGKFSVELLASCTGHDATRLRRLLRHVERVHWFDDGTAIAAHAEARASCCAHDAQGAFHRPLADARRGRRCPRAGRTARRDPVAAAAGRLRVDFVVGGRRRAAHGYLEDQA